MLDYDRLAALAGLGPEDWRARPMEPRPVDGFSPVPSPDGFIPQDVAYPQPVMPQVQPDRPANGFLERVGQFLREHPLSVGYTDRTGRGFGITTAGKPQNERVSDEAAKQNQRNIAASEHARQLRLHALQRAAAAQRKAAAAARKEKKPETREERSARIEADAAARARGSAKGRPARSATVTRGGKIGPSMPELSGTATSLRNQGRLASQKGDVGAADSLETLASKVSRAQAAIRQAQNFDDLKQIVGAIPDGLPDDIQKQIVRAVQLRKRQLGL